MATIAIFHGLGDCVIATTLLRPLKQKFPKARIVWATSERYAPLVEHNPCVDEIRAFPGNLYLEQAQPVFKQLRAEYGNELIIAGPYYNPEAKDGTLLGSHKERIRKYAPGSNVPFIPELYLVQPEVDLAKKWVSDRNLKKFVILETQFGSSQSFWKRKHTDNALQIFARKGYSVVLAHQEDPNLAEFNQICPTYCLDVHFRVIPAIYNQASAFVGVSSGVSCIVHTHQCRNDIPHIEFVNGEHWATRQFLHKTTKVVSFEPEEVCPLLERLP